MAATSARMPRGMSLCSVYRPYRYPRCWFPVFRQKSRKRSAIVWFSNMMLSTCLYFCLTKFKRQAILGTVWLLCLSPAPSQDTHYSRIPQNRDTEAPTLPSAAASPWHRSQPHSRTHRGPECGEVLSTPSTPLTWVPTAPTPRAFAAKKRH